MAQNVLAQPPTKTDARFDDWMFRLWRRVGQAGQILWGQIDTTGGEFVGDSGSGGVRGLVPAPDSGDAGKYLKGDGTWASVAAGGMPSNIIGTATTIETDTSYLVVGYLKVNAALTVNGNLGVI